MGVRLFIVRKGVSVLSDSRNAVVLPLVLSLVIAPLSANATGDFSSASMAATAPPPAGQAGAQQQNANNNSMAANLGKLSSVLSMAAGGLYMAKGAEQMKCCTSGCSGSGSASQTTKDNLDKATNNNVKNSGLSGVPKRQPVNYWKLRFPDEAGNCPAQRKPEFAAPGIFQLFGLFRPQKADAALGPCLDAAIALATGGLMMLNGIMGLQAANQSGQMANSSLGNAGNMNSYPVATTGASAPGTSNLGNGTGASNTIKLDPALLRTGKANDIMSQLENKFGLGRDQFANSVLGGDDPRSLFNHAPKNPLSNDDMNKATKGAKAMSDADKANALAGTPLSDAQRDLASKLGTGQGDPAFAVNSGASAAALTAFGKKKDSEPDDLGLPAADTASLALSPDVKAALAAKELDDRRNGITDLTIFQVVHAKYRERSKMIFGFDPDGMPKGVGNADGL